MTINRNSLISNIEIKLNSLQDEVFKLLSSLSVKTDNNRFKTGEFQGVNVNEPSCAWKKLTVQQEKQHIKISKQYKSLIQILDNLIVEHATDRIDERYNIIKKEFQTWVLLEKNFKLENSLNTNRKYFLESVNLLREIIDLLQSEVKLIIVPDTNALLIEPDPIKYKEIIKEKSFTFILLPIIISELDKLKINHEKDQLKEKAKKLIKRIKGWRSQGNITEGVTLDKTISLKAEVIEPNFKKMPSFLNIDNNDDNIIMYILDIQRRFPSAIVILVSKDINMQNKAEHVMIECIDIEMQKELKSENANNNPTKNRDR